MTLLKDVDDHGQKENVRIYSLFERTQVLIHLRLLSKKFKVKKESEPVDKWKCHHFVYPIRNVTDKLKPPYIKKNLGMWALKNVSLSMMTFKNASSSNCFNSFYLLFWFLLIRCLEPWRAWHSRIGRRSLNRIVFFFFSEILTLKEVC